MAILDYSLDLANVPTAITDGADPGSNIVDLGRGKDAWKTFYFHDWTNMSMGYSIKVQIELMDVVPANLNLQVQLDTSADGATWTTLVTTPAVAGPHPVGTVLADIVLPKGIQRLLRVKIIGGTPTGGMYTAFIYQNS